MSRDNQRYSWNISLFNSLRSTPYYKRCRKRVSPPAGRFKTNWGEICKTTANPSSARVPRVLSAETLAPKCL